MPALTRRRDPDAHREAWLIHYGDIHVGSIAERTGNPSGSPQWHWTCGFYPGCNPGEWTTGTAPSFETARAAFEAAWAVFLAKRTEADFEAYRRHEAFEAWKEAMWAAGCKLPTQVAEGCSVCFCGAAIGIGDVEPHALRVYAQSTPAFLKQAFHPLLMKTSLSHQTAMG